MSQASVLRWLLMGGTSMIGTLLGPEGSAVGWFLRVAGPLLIGVGCSVAGPVFLRIGCTFVWCWRGVGSVGLPVA